MTKSPAEALSIHEEVQTTVAPLQTGVLPGQHELGDLRVRVTLVSRDKKTRQRQVQGLHGVKRWPWIWCVFICVFACGVLGLTPAFGAAAQGKITVTAPYGANSIRYMAVKIFSGESQDGTKLKGAVWASDAVKKNVLEVIRRFSPQYVDPSHPMLSAQRAEEYIQAHIVNKSRDANLGYAASGSFAMELARALREINPTKTFMGGAPTELEQGYYLVLTNNEETAPSVSAPIFVMVSSLPLTVAQKSEAPLFDARVVDVRDSDDADLGLFEAYAPGRTSLAACTHETLVMQEDVVLPMDTVSYNAYPLTFTTALPEGVTVAQSSCALYYYEAKSSPAAGTRLDSEAARSVSFATPQALQSGVSFDVKKGQVTCTVADLRRSVGSTLKPFSKVVLRFKATVQRAEDCERVLTAQLSYNANPYALQLKTTDQKRVSIFQYGVKIHAQDMHDADVSLAGSVFTLREIIGTTDGNGAGGDGESALNTHEVAALEGLYVAADGSHVKEPVQLIANEQGDVLVEGLGEGTYVLEQVGTAQIPNGSTYEPMSAATISVSSNATSLGAAGEAREVDLELTCDAASLNTPKGNAGRLHVADAVDSQGQETGSGISAEEGTVQLIVRNAREATLPKTGFDTQNTLPLVIGALLLFGLGTAVRLKMRRDESDNNLQF